MTPHPFDPTIALDDGRAELRIEQTWDTDAADLWDAVSDPGRLARWFAPILGTPSVGGEFGIHFDDGDVPGMTLLSCDPVAPHVRLADRGRPDRGAGRGAGGDPDDQHARPHPPVAAPGEGARVRRRVGGDVGQLRDHLDGREGGDWWSDFGASRDRLRERLARLPG